MSHVEKKYRPDEHAFTACIRAAIWDTDPTSRQAQDAHSDENSVYQTESGDTSHPQSLTNEQITMILKSSIARRHQCTHLLTMWAVEHDRITPDNTIRRDFFITTQRTLRQNHLLADTLSLFSANHIPAILLKGYGLTTLYPTPAMREYGDVDIYVGDAHYDAAVNILCAHYPNAYWCSPTHVGHHFIMVLDDKRDLVIELHNHFCTLDRADEQAFAIFTRHALYPLQTLELNGVDVPVPNSRFNALYLFLHAWEHFISTGVGFRPLIDWMLTLHQLAHQLTAAEWQTFAATLQHTLRAMHLLRPWQTFGAVLVQYLGLARNEFPLYNPNCESLAQRLYLQILHDGQGTRALTPKHEGTTTRRSCLEIHAFPLRRPTKNRILQRAHTAMRVLYDTLQLAKFFPAYALRKLMTTIACRSTKGVQARKT